MSKAEEYIYCIQQNIRIKIDQDNLYNLRKYKYFKHIYTRKNETFVSIQKESALKAIFDSIKIIEKNLDEKSKNKLEIILNSLDIDQALKLVFKKDIKLEKEIKKLINENKRLKQKLKKTESNN